MRSASTLRLVASLYKMSIRTAVITLVASLIFLVVANYSFVMHNVVSLWIIPQMILFLVLAIAISVLFSYLPQLKFLPLKLITIPILAVFIAMLVQWMTVGALLVPKFVFFNLFYIALIVLISNGLVFGFQFLGAPIPTD